MLQCGVAPHNYRHGWRYRTAQWAVSSLRIKILHFQAKSQTADQSQILHSLQLPLGTSSKSVPSVQTKAGREIKTVHNEECELFWVSPPTDLSPQPTVTIFPPSTNKCNWWSLKNVQDLMMVVTLADTCLLKVKQGQILKIFCTLLADSTYSLRLIMILGS